MAGVVTANLTLRNGECKEYKEVISKQIEPQGRKLDGLINSLTKIQKNINNSLTEVVEAERGASNTTKQAQGTFEE